MKLLSFFFFSFFLFSFFTTISFSQDIGETPAKKSKGAKGFHAGLFVGSYYANKYTSKLYDGWGYDVDGKRNDFTNSFMNRRINYDFGGGYGQIDQVALALGVNHGEWSFDETDMPTKMKYTSTFIYGVQMNYGFTKKDALVININAAKINAGGNFTITVLNPLIGPQQPGYKDLRTFSITGSEQRLIMQTGYRRILGENEILNFFVEAGPSFNFTKYIRNQITINNLPIDMAFYYTQQYYPTYRASYLRGTGWGAFGSIGLNLTANPKWTLQFLYNPSFEKINIGEEPKITLQNSFGLRAFYNL